MGHLDQAVIRYADVLGDRGLARYRELAESMWADVPRLSPGEDTGERYGERFRITRIMQCLAERSGSLQQQLAVAERDLSSAYCFLQIAELCREHEEDEQALQLAERGMAAFSERPDPRLRSFLIDEYRRRGLAADALEHSLQGFSERATLESYRELATDAKALGGVGRATPMGALAASQPRIRPTSARATLVPARARLLGLVRVLLWEGDRDGAWRAATEGGCTPQLWLELAELRRAEHPQDALEVYRRHVEQVIAGKDKRAYAEAAHLIDQTVRALFVESGRPEDFDACVEEVRTTTRPSAT